MIEKVKKLIDILNLKPLPIEGGFFRETYRSTEEINIQSLPTRYSNSKVFSTAIYYLLTSQTFSAIHKLPTDEIFHFYLGDQVEMLQLYEDGTGKIVKIGCNIEKGELPQIIVPKNTWQGSRLIKGGEFALLGTTMAPGFEFQDLILPTKEKLIEDYPNFYEQIIKLL